MKLLYRVGRPFQTKAAISGRERQFVADEIFFVDSGQKGPTLLIDTDEFLFSVDRMTFDSCCMIQGGASG